jgi:predicted phosphoribosyltransferase
VVTNDEVIGPLGISRSTFEAVVAREKIELERREQFYRDDRPAPVLENRTVLLVDDGLATGSTMRAAIAALRGRAARIVVAAPVASGEICSRLRREADEVVCSLTPDPFHAVGFWYGDFTQVSDEEVKALLRAAGSGRTSRASPS